MKYNSQIFSEASGALGGVVFSHNAGGQYVRKRVVPTKKEQGPQADARARMVFAAGEWTGLTEVQQEAWRLYGANTDWVNTLGATINLNGRAHFIRSLTTRRWAAGLGADVGDGPVDFGLPVFSPCVVAGSEATQQLTLNFDNTDGWCIADGGALILQGSPAFGPEKTVYGGPFLIAGKVLGNTAAPPASPLAIDSPYPFLENNRVFYRLVATTADGRVSAAVSGFLSAGA